MAKLMVVGLSTYHRTCGYVRLRTQQRFSEVGSPSSLVHLVTGGGEGGSRSMGGSSYNFVRILAPLQVQFDCTTQEITSSLFFLNLGALSSLQKATLRYFREGGRERRGGGDTAGQQEKAARPGVKQSAVRDCCSN